MKDSQHNRLVVFKIFIENLAGLSKCTDKGVAAIITDKALTQVLSIGVNGGVSGGSDCLCNTSGKYTCIHAEANAIAKCTTDLHDKTMLCTLSPCVTCAALIANSGIKVFGYVTQHKDTSGLQLLREAGVEIITLDKLTSIPVIKQKRLPPDLQVLWDKLLCGKSVFLPHADMHERESVYNELRTYAEYEHRQLIMREDFTSYCAWELRLI